jgi:hypothetical protein
MRTHVEFRSGKFPPYPGEEAEVNPGLWGKRLAEYLCTQLRARGVMLGEIYAEDWGWEVPVQNDAFPMWIGCGRYQEYPDGYLVFIEPSRPTVRKGLFRRIDTTADVERVAGILDGILRSDSEIREVRWWSENEK